MADILQKTASSLVKRKLSLLFCRSFGQEWGMIGQASLLPGWHWVLFGILLHLFCWNVLSQKGAKKRWTYVLIWDRHRCSHKVHITEEIKLHHTWLHTNRWQCQHFFSRQTRKLADMLQVSTKANMSQKYQIQQNIWNVLFAVWKKYSSKHDHSK